MAHRFVFKCQAAFATPGARQQFGADADQFIANNAALFTNTVSYEMDWHGTMVWLVRGECVAKQNLDTVFGALKTQVINRGAIAPAFLWVKEVQREPGDGVIDSISAKAPEWVDTVPAEGL